VAKAKSEVDVLINDINTEYGPGTIIWGNRLKYEQIPRISSGSLALDVALGGGWTVNSWHEIYGDFSAGKTTLILKTIANQQKLEKNWTVFWVAAEEFVPEFATMLGCDISRIMVMQTNIFEEATNSAIRALESRTIDCLVIDSLPALSPITEAENTMDDSQVALVARLLGKFFRKAYTAQKRSLIEDDRPVTCFMANQWREKIGVLFGDNRITPGGRAKDYWYSTRVEVKRDEWLVEGEKKNQRKVGIAIKALTKKNKGYPPERTAVFDFYFDQNELELPPGSYDKVKEIIGLAIYFDLLQSGGGYYTYGDHRWHGRTALEEAVRSDLPLCERMRSDVMSCVVKGRRLEETTPTSAPKRVLRRGK
jgi:recombination protein RecA